MLRDSSVVVRTHPRAIPLDMITTRKSIHGFCFSSLFRYVAPLGGPPGRRSSAINVTRFRKTIQKTLVVQVLHNMQNVFNPNFVLLRAAKECTKIQNAPAWLLYCSYTFRLVSSHRRRRRCLR